MCLHSVSAVALSPLRRLTWRAHRREAERGRGGRERGKCDGRCKREERRGTEGKRFTLSSHARVWNLKGCDRRWGEWQWQAPFAWPLFAAAAKDAVSASAARGHKRGQLVLFLYFCCSSERQDDASNGARAGGCASALCPLFALSRCCCASGQPAR